MTKKATTIYSLIIIAAGAAAMIFIHLNYAKPKDMPLEMSLGQKNIIKSEDNISNISFEVNGRINYISKSVGEHVSSGEVLARIDDSDAVVQYNNAKQGVVAAQATLDALHDSLKAEKLKLSYLKKSHEIDVQKKQVDLIKNNIQAQEAQILQAQEAVKGAGLQVDKYSLKAPFDGIITRQDINLGEIISPNVSVVSVLADNPSSAK